MNTHSWTCITCTCCTDRYVVITAKKEKKRVFLVDCTHTHTLTLKHFHLMSGCWALCHNVTLHHLYTECKRQDMCLCVCICWCVFVLQHTIVSWVEANNEVCNDMCTIGIFKNNFMFFMFPPSVCSEHFSLSKGCFSIPCCQVFPSFKKLDSNPQFLIVFYICGWRKSLQRNASLIVSNQNM